jgi:hypothetical protein
VAQHGDSQRQLFEAFLFHANGFPGDRHTMLRKDGDLLTVTRRRLGMPIVKNSVQVDRELPEELQFARLGIMQTAADRPLA